jgi:hypothetical protein
MKNNSYKKKHFANLLAVLLITSFSIYSCKSTPEKDLNKVVEVSEEGAFNAEMKAIDSEIETVGKLASSLNFSKEDGSTIVVRAHLSENDDILKIEEEFNDGEKKGFGTKSFYYRQGKIFATREYMEEHLAGKEAKFIDRISYYDKNEKVTKTLEKRVSFEEELEGLPYNVVEKFQVDPSRAKKVLDQKDEFKITFQGIIDVNALNYLIVGSPGSDGYTSAIRVDFTDPFIKALTTNQKAYMNKEIEVVFQNITDDTGFQYQSYIQGKFIE